MPELNEKPHFVMLKTLARVSYLGIRIAVCILFGVLLGRYLDRLFGTFPGLLLVCSLLGAGAAFKIIFDIMKTG